MVTEKSMSTQSDKPMEGWEFEFDKKFDHFNDLYLGHKRNDKLPDAGKQICSWDCDKVSDLDDVKQFIQQAIEDERKEILGKVEEIVGKQEKLPSMEATPYMWAEGNARNYLRKEILNSLRNK